MKKVSKDEAIAGLSIPQTANALQFRTKAKTLVATGYEKVRRDEDTVVRVYFKDAQVDERKLVEIEPGRMAINGIRTGVSAKYNSNDDAKVEFLPLFPPGGAFPVSLLGRWKATAADLYVDGVAVYTLDSEPEPKSKPLAQIAKETAASLSAK
jgi:hypothetical protein